MHRSIALSPQMPTFVMAEKRNCTRAPLFRNFVKCACAKVGPKNLIVPLILYFRRHVHETSLSMFCSFFCLRGETGSVREERRGERWGQWVQCINFEGGGGRTENYPHASNNGPAAAADARCTGPPRARAGASGNSKSDLGRLQNWAERGRRPQRFSTPPCPAITIPSNVSISPCEMLF